MSLRTLPKLQALVDQISPTHHWKVEKNAIVQVPGKKENVDNVIDLIRSVRFTQDVMASSEGANLNKSETKRIYTPLAETSYKLQETIEKLSFWKKIYLAVLTFIFTGTTLSRATAALQNTVVNVKKVDNEYAAKLAHPILMADAELALKDRESYREVAKRYPIPPDLEAKIERSALQKLTNGLIYHLRQTFVYEWKEARRLLQKGQTLESPEVMNHYDAAMQVGLILTKLLIAHELEELMPYIKAMPGCYDFVENDTPKQRLAKLLSSQGPGGYPYFVVSQFTRLYSEIRKCPAFVSGQWQSGHGGVSFEKQFYEEGKRPHLWNKAYNEFVHFLADHVDIQTFRTLPRYEMTFYAGGDETKDTCDPSLLKYQISDDNSLKEWFSKKF